jgi:DNA-binding response OmpR family regulator
LRRALLITSHPRDLSSLEGVLVREGYRAMTSAPDEDAVIDAVSQLTPEILLVDCRRDGQQAAEMRRLLGNDCDIKEVQVVALLTEEQASEMDWAGIDEFILPPYSGEELLARLRLLFWRTRKIDSDQAIKIGGLLIDMLNYEITVDGSPVEVTFKEYELLRFLATHRGRVFTREALLNHVWGYDYYGGTRTIDVHVRRLRAKLAPEYDALIETVRNVGYRFSS